MQCILYSILFHTLYKYYYFSMDGPSGDFSLTLAHRPHAVLNF